MKLNNKSTINDLQALVGKPGRYREFRGWLTAQVVRIEIEEDEIFVVLESQMRFSREKRVKLSHFEPAPEKKPEQEIVKKPKKEEKPETKLVPQPPPALPEIPEE